MDSYKAIQKYVSSPEMLAKLKEMGELMVFEKNEVLLNERAYIQSIPIVISGTVKVMQSDDEMRELFLYYIQPGETCIMSFLGGMHNEQSKIKAIAETNCEVLMIPLSQTSQLIRAFPEWVEYIFKIYHIRYEELLQVVNEVSFKKMDERILDFIRRRMSVSGTNQLQVTHEELANELGTARVVVSRLLKQMEKGGIIKLGRNKISLL